MLKMEKWIFQKHLGTGVSGYVVLAQDGEERRAVKIPKLATSDTTHANMPRGKMEGDVRGLQCYSAEQQRQASRRD